MNTDLEEFAEHVRQKAVRILAVIDQYPERAKLLTAELISEANRTAQQLRMAQEVSEPDRYDLAALPMPGQTGESE